METHDAVRLIFSCCGNIATQQVLKWGAKLATGRWTGDLDSLLFRKCMRKLIILSSPSSIFSTHNHYYSCSLQLGVSLWNSGYCMPGLQKASLVVSVANVIYCTYSCCMPLFFFYVGFAYWATSIVAKVKYPQVLGSQCAQQSTKGGRILFLNKLFTQTISTPP